MENVFRFASAAAIGASALVWSGVACAQSPWSFDLGVATDFPIAVGAIARVEGPYRLRATTSVGVLPGPYVDAINGVLVAAEVYDDTTAKIIRATLQTSLVWRTHVGWRPWAHRGFHFEVGYGLVTLGGGLTSQELLTAVTGMAPPEMMMSSQQVAFSAEATLHMLDLVLGWEWTFYRDHLVLRAALGFAGTVASTTHIRPDFTPRRPMAVAQLTKAGEDYLNDVFTSYVFVPTFTVGASWRF